MKITKLTKNTYLFYKEGEDYILNLGQIKKGEDTTTELLFEEVGNADTTKVSPKCGCTAVDRKKIDSTSFSIKIKYANCDSTFTKIVAINEGKTGGFKIKIKGTCRQ
jgi:hypothetical protein